MIRLWYLIVATAHLALATQPFQAQFVRSTTGREVLISIDGGPAHRTFAGKMGFRYAGGTWESVCGNVRGPISPGQIFTVKPYDTASVGGNIAKAGNIIALHFRGAETPDECAGLQLAIWKAVEDGTPDADFTTGHFQAAASSNVIGFAQQYYMAIQTKGTATFLAAVTNGGHGTGQGGGGGQSQFTLSSSTAAPPEK